MQALRCLSLFACVVAAAAALAAPACSPNACLRVSDCAGGEVCVDSRCVVPTDAGPDAAVVHEDASHDARHDVDTDATVKEKGDAHEDARDGGDARPADRDATMDGDARDASPVCVPGQQIACSCPGARSGVQVCEASGTSYDACGCPDADVDGSATDAHRADARHDAGSRTCTPGQQIECACPGGTSGVQVCASDGDDYGACECGGALDGSARDGADASRLCTPGQPVACPCPGGGSSTQVCAADGESYEACRCSDGGSARDSGVAPKDATADVIACVPGEQVACGCGAGKTGYEVCAMSGDSFGACQCPAQSDSGAEAGTSCSPGASIQCPCLGGGSSTQTCLSNGGGYGACACSGASKDAGPARPTCVPGQQVSCACAGGTLGVQACADSGADYEPCDCTDAVSTRDASSDAAGRG